MRLRILLTSYVDAATLKTRLKQVHRHDSGQICSLFAGFILTHTSRLFFLLIKEMSADANCSFYILLC